MEYRKIVRKFSLKQYFKAEQGGAEPRAYTLFITAYNSINSLKKTTCNGKKNRRKINDKEQSLLKLFKQELFSITLIAFSNVTFSI